MLSFDYSRVKRERAAGPIIEHMSRVLNYLGLIFLLVHSVWIHRYKSIPGKSANSSLDTTDCVHVSVYMCVQRGFYMRAVLCRVFQYALILLLHVCKYVGLTPAVSGAGGAPAYIEFWTLNTPFFASPFFLSTFPGPPF